LPIGLAFPFPKSEEWCTMETKFFRLRTAVALGSRFDDWQVCWLGGWAKHRLYFMVMLVKVAFMADRTLAQPREPEERSSNGKRRRGNTGGAKGGDFARSQASTE
jgi:hypothetical protein